MSLTDLTFQNPTDLVNRAAFNERFEMLNNALFNNGGNVVDILGNSVGVKVETGSYVGTGTYGQNNKNNLTFNFTPKIICIQAAISAFIESGNGLIWQGQAGSGVLFFSSNFNTFSWYSPSSANIQLNVSGTTYNYIAIG